MTKHIVIRAQSGVGASIPGDEVNGRFHIRGVVTEGPKAIIGKRVEIQMTHAVAEYTVNGLASSLLQHPKCGIRPTIEQED